MASPRPPPPLPMSSRVCLRVSSTPSHLPHILPVLSLLLLLLHILPTPSSSRSSSSLSYAGLCGGPAPESVSSTGAADPYPSFVISTGYFSGGDALFGLESPSPSPALTFPRSFSFLPRSVLPTKSPGALHLAGTLVLRGARRGFRAVGRNLTEGRALLHRVRPRIPRTFSLRASVSFELEGFWFESTGKLCMVGNGFGRSKEGTSVHLGAVLKLNFLKRSNLSASFITGSLDSSDPPTSSDHFDTISVVAYAQGNYEYTQIAQAESSCSRFPDEGGLRVFGSSFSCVHLQNLLRGEFRLENGRNCSDGNCFLPGGTLGDFMYLNQVHCSDDGKLHVFTVFSNESRFAYPSLVVGEAALVGEGVWDQEQNQLCLRACNVLISEATPANLSVGACPFVMSFSFPTVWSIKSRSIAIGRVWILGHESEADNFRVFSYHRIGNYIGGLPGLQYNYTMIDAVRKFCGNDDSLRKKKGRYPDWKSSSDLRFQFFVKNAGGKSNLAFADPVTIGNMFLGGSSMWGGLDPVFQPASSELNYSSMNISYKISYLLPTASSIRETAQISAEGVYNAETGALCLVGCQYIDRLDVAQQAKLTDPMDCEVLINVQFAPLNGNKGERMKGTIRSTRDKMDPLFFAPLEISSHGIYMEQSAESIWRMNLEITMVLITLSVSCFLIAFQLFHVKKNPEVLSSISITMLGILSLSYMIPLVLNFEELFFRGLNKQNVLLRSGGWLEVNQVIVRVMTMVAFLLQVRLLQVAWTSRSIDESKRAAWFAERKALWVCLPLYVVGGLITWFAQLRFNETSEQKPSMVPVHQYTLWVDLMSYAGLMLDGFLLPQFVFNIFLDSKDKALTSSFYVGNTILRALPHWYDAYRAQHYVPVIKSTYIYARPNEDIYTHAWDIVIPCGGMFFSLMIYLQQRLGGAFFLRRNRRSSGYEMVPVVTP